MKCPHCGNPMLKKIEAKKDKVIWHCKTCGREEEALDPPVWNSIEAYDETSK